MTRPGLPWFNPVNLLVWVFELCCLCALVLIGRFCGVPILMSISGAFRVGIGGRYQLEICSVLYEVSNKCLYVQFRDGMRKG